MPSERNQTKKKKYVLYEYTYIKFQNTQIKPQCPKALTRKVVTQGMEGGCGKHREILPRGNGYVHYLDHGDGFPLGVYRCQNASDCCFKYVQLIVGQLYFHESCKRNGNTCSFWKLVV